MVRRWWSTYESSGVFGMNHRPRYNAPCDCCGSTLHGLPRCYHTARLRSFQLAAHQATKGQDRVACRLEDAVRLRRRTPATGTLMGSVRMGASLSPALYRFLRHKRLQGRENCAF